VLGYETAEARKLIRLAGGLQRHDDADLAEMSATVLLDVSRDPPAARQHGGAAQRDVLADLGDRDVDVFAMVWLPVWAALIASMSLRPSRRPGRSSSRGPGTCRCDDEVGLRIDLDQDSFVGAERGPRSALRPRRGRPSWPPWRGPSCAASRPPSGGAAGLASACLQSSCPRRSPRGAPHHCALIVAMIGYPVGFGRAGSQNPARSLTRSRRSSPGCATQPSTRPAAQLLADLVTSAALKRGDLRIVKNTDVELLLDRGRDAVVS